MAGSTVGLAAQSADYAIVGEVGDAVEQGEAVLSRSTAVLGSSAEVARVPIADGRFRFEGEVTDDMGRVSLSVRDADDNSKGSAQFILEPGEIRISHAGRVAGFAASGGPYNDKVVSVWWNSEEYQAVLADYAEVMDAKADLEEGPEREALTEEAVRLYNELNGIRGAALRKVALADGDPLASIFAIEMGGLGRTEALNRLDQLRATELLPATVAAMRSRIETGIRMSDTAKTVQVGSEVKDFSAPGIDGETYHLGDALADNEILLIEFWASWCGPCRTEVPTLKAAVEQYGERGFDIFAFSLDDDREDWVEASDEDGITWINTSDLGAYDSPVPAQFGVLAIPMNVLVDSDGVILAKYIRGEDLLAKLDELLGDV
ncbi:MAG: AhpC/TSA family protein [Pseudomonadales bacterium]|nr:AhpC/TSA family protein [Pseudomonadales bacterium]